MTVGRQITEAIAAHEGVGRREARERAIELLGDVGLPQPERRIDDHPHQFSGGMRQRVMIAMAICTNPDVLIADEPTTALDVTTQARIMEMLGQIVEERRMGVILITHDLGLASSFCDDIHVMYAGRIVETWQRRRGAEHPRASVLGGSARLDLRARPRRRPPDRRDLGAAAAAAPAAVRLSVPPALRIRAGGLHGRAAACGRRTRAGRGVPLPRPGGDGVSATDMTAARTEPVHNGEQLLVVDHLSRHFRLGGRRSRRIVKAVDDVSLVLSRGETIGLVGESGSGKSTLARLLLRLDEPTSGSVHFESTDLFGISRRELRRLRREMQIVFQDPYASLNKRKTVEQIVSFPLVVHERSLSRKERSVRVAELLELVGLRPEHASAFPRQLSGGQCQRVNIARALALNPKLVVLDEAVSAVDVSIQAQILNLLRELQDQLDLTYLFVTHDLAVVRYMADTIAVMYLGRIVEQAPRDSLFADPQHPYTHALLASIPPAPGDTQREQIVLREAPAADTLPSGCRFHPRCPLGERELCRTVDPPLHAAGAGHTVACHFPQSAGSLLAEVAREQG